MSIVLINNSQETFTPTQSGAIATWIWEVCQCARLGGCHPWVVTRDSTAARYEWEQTVVVTYPKVPENRLQILVARAERKASGHTAIGLRRYAARLIAALRERRLDALPLVLHNDLELAVQLRQAFPQALIVHHFHNQIVCKPRFLGRVAKSCNAITAVSRFTGAWVETQLGLPTGSVRTIFNGVDCKRFSPASQVPGGVPVINFLGRTGIEKAPDILLEAALIVAARTRNFSIQIMGSNYWHKFEKDQYQTKLESLTCELKRLNIRIRNAGHVTRAEVPGEMQKCRINVMPSRWDEPFGLATLEGMACGLATVATDTGGTPEVLAGAGLLFPRDDKKALAEHLWHLISDEKLLLEMSKSARQRAEQLTWQATWDALCNALASIKKTRVKNLPELSSGRVQAI